MYQLLALLSLSLLASASSGPMGAPMGSLSEPILEVRQAPAAPPVVAGPGNTLTPACFDYSLTANYSTIGANSTYRSTYLQLSPLGSIPVQRMLNAHMKKLPPMTANANLNRDCGNWTTIAFVEGEKNFTDKAINGVGGLTGLDKLGNPQSIVRAGPELIAILGVVLLLFHGVWCFMP
jgi:hypothetical protein